MRRRDFLALGIAYPMVVPGYRVQFPRDEGSHPAFRQEWWYATGWLRTLGGADIGFQATFFRARPDIVTDNPSDFTPRQVVLAHAAISDPRRGHLQHGERAARVALGLAGAEEDALKVWVDDWRLEFDGKVYRVQVNARQFAYDLALFPSGPPLLEGDNGFSRKGRRDAEASYYYSRPQLGVGGYLDGKQVSGLAWLDHEWSSEYMPAAAEGWDWCGLNLEGGGALMAFRMRGAGGKRVYSGGTLVTHEGAKPLVFKDGEVQFETLTTWRSPRTGTTYPVGIRVWTPGGVWRLAALMPDQELDARASTGTIYWEGAVSAFGQNAPRGRGYLELTGYWKPLQL